MAAAGTIENRDAKAAVLAKRAERGYWLIETDEWEPMTANEWCNCREFQVNCHCTPEIRLNVERWACPCVSPGAMRRKRFKTVDEVRSEILIHLGCEYLGIGDYVSDDAICRSPEEGGYHMEGLSNFLDMVNGYPQESTPWPEGRIYVTSVRGSSEGDYVHVEVCPPNGTDPHICVLLAKTFAGRDAAWRFARVLADLLGA